MVAIVALFFRVTKLVIKRPYSFKHSPGDWLFLRIPAIANYEWHPFTISSAPEERDVLTVHVRGVGQWTNRVYQLFEERKARTLSRVYEKKILMSNYIKKVFLNAGKAISAAPTSVWSTRWRLSECQEGGATCEA